jgi:hypothetical protein
LETHYLRAADFMEQTAALMAVAVGVEMLAQLVDAGVDHKALFGVAHQKSVI